MEILPRETTRFSEKGFLMVKNFIMAAIALFIVGCGGNQEGSEQPLASMDAKEAAIVVENVALVAVEALTPVSVDELESTNGTVECSNGGFIEYFIEVDGDSVGISYEAIDCHNGYMVLNGSLDYLYSDGQAQIYYQDYTMDDTFIDGVVVARGERVNSDLSIWRNGREYISTLSFTDLGEITLVANGGSVTSNGSTLTPIESLIVFDGETHHVAFELDGELVELEI